MFRMQVIYVILVAGIAIILTSCSDGNNIAQQNKEIVMKSTEAMNNQEYDKYDQFFAEDFTRHCQATPEMTITSLEQMIAFVKEWYDAFPDAKMVMKKMIAEDDLVAVWATFIGTHQGPMGNIPATGKKIESETFAFFRIEDGKIAELWVTWDNVAIMKQLGLMSTDLGKSQ